MRPANAVASWKSPGSPPASATNGRVQSCPIRYRNPRTVQRAKSPYPHGCRCSKPLEFTHTSPRRPSFFSDIVKLAANASGGADALQTYELGERRLNVYELALVGLSDAGANDRSGVLISTLRKKIRARVNDESWNNAHLKAAVERLAAVELKIEYRRAPIPNATDRPLLIVDDKVFVTNPLFRIFLFWCLLPQLGLQNRVPLD
jgi:hypothetical protein